VESVSNKHLTPLWPKEKKKRMCHTNHNHFAHLMIMNALSQWCHFYKGMLNDKSCGIQRNW